MTMPTTPTPKRKLPVLYPSVADIESEPPQYNEEDIKDPLDRVPRSRFVLADTPADLRMRVERLLQHREAATVEEWDELGPDARTMLVDLLDDPTVHADPELLRRVVAVAGLLGLRRAIAPLGTLLNDAGEAAITRAQAANALGRIGEAVALDALVSAGNDTDDVVRRQVAIALGRLDREVGTPHLLSLQHDKSVAVAEAAAEALRRRHSAARSGSGRARRKRAPLADE